MTLPPLYVLGFIVMVAGGAAVLFGLVVVGFVVARICDWLGLSDRLRLSERFAVQSRLIRRWERRRVAVLTGRWGVAPPVFPTRVIR